MSSPGISESNKEKIDNYIANEHVFVASKSYCPYCKRAKQILKDAGVTDAKIIELDEMDEGPSIQEYLQSITGQRTVPNIFINGKHIGGCDDLTSLQQSGKLKSLL